MASAVSAISIVAGVASMISATIGVVGYKDAGFDPSVVRWFLWVAIGVGLVGIVSGWLMWRHYRDGREFKHGVFGP